ncbi:MAG: sugar transferase [Fibrobacteria bacterium]|nr:sugar transferase [Fibrobacteria bacterium]
MQAVASIAERVRESIGHRPRQLPWLTDLVVAVRQFGDAASLMLGQWIGYLLLGMNSPQTLADPSAMWISSFCATGTMLLLMSYVGLNKDDHSILNIRETQKILRSWLLATGAVLLLLYLARIGIARMSWILAWSIALLTLLVHRDLFWHLSRWLHRKRIVGSTALIYGTGNSARMLLKKLRLMPDMGVHVAGFLDDDPSRLGTKVEGITILGDSTELRPLLRLTGANKLYIALSQVPRRTVTEILSVCRARGVDFQIVPNLQDMALPRIRIEEIDGVPLLGVSQAQLRPWRAVMKRGLDIVLGSLILLVVSPALLLGMAFAESNSKGSVFMTFRRVGKGGRLIHMLRLRVGPRSDAPPSTAGTILHRFAIDALPMLINVIQGDMSLVGPRAARVKDVAGWDEFHRLRLNVRPGITGLWRILPDAPAEGDDSLDIDLQYIHHQSLLLDLSILLETLRNLALPRKSPA